VRAMPSGQSTASEVSEGMPAKRLSTASIRSRCTGCDPDRRPRHYGKIGNSGRVDRTLDEHEGVYVRGSTVPPA